MIHQLTILSVCLYLGLALPTGENVFLLNDQQNPSQPVTNSVLTLPEVRITQNIINPKKEVVNEAEVRNAQYQYSSEVKDNIVGSYQNKRESRQNGVVTGQYSYDDGYVWKTVFYTADKNGFRITKAEDRPPHMKPLDGHASVQNKFDGTNYQYNMTENDVACLRKKIKTII